MTNRQLDETLSQHLAAVEGRVRTLEILFGAGQPVLVKAGVPTDADYAVPPPDGTLAVNSSTSKIFARIAGTWVQVTT